MWIRTGSLVLMSFKCWCRRSTTK